MDLVSPNERDGLLLQDATWRGSIIMVVDHDDPNHYHRSLEQHQQQQRMSEDDLLLDPGRGSNVRFLRRRPLASKSRRRVKGTLHASVGFLGPALIQLATQRALQEFCNNEGCDPDTTTTVVDDQFVASIQG